MTKDNDSNYYDYSNYFDEIDLKLLDLFLKNQNSKRISEDSKIPINTVKRRTQNMLKEGLVTQRAEINYEKIGINKAFLFINISKEDHTYIAKELFKIKQMISISITIYNFDFVCTAIFIDNNELYQIISSVKKISGVKEVLVAQEINNLKANTDSNIQHLLPFINK
jgi:DNA-binding Lrp family transcriptional regulator